MKKTIITTIIFVFAITSLSFAQYYGQQQKKQNYGYNSDTEVKGYFKQNGTYVNPYHRSNPDGRLDNNYSSEYNYNPYTGKQGKKKTY